MTLAALDDDSATGDIRADDEDHGDRDPLRASLVLGLPEDSLLAVFNRSGVLAASDVHVALRLGRMGGDSDEVVALAAALAVRAPRVGHVRIDLATVRETAAAEIADEIDVSALPWPDPAEWAEHLASSPLVSVGEEAESARPLRLAGEALYLDRYWNDEIAVAADLMGRSLIAGPEADGASLASEIERLFPGASAEAQRWAAGTAVLRRLTVIAGGPGTGKTTTVARVIALLATRAEALGADSPLVGLAAPTGKAAARMEEAVRSEAASMEISPLAKQRLGQLRATTIHRLLGRMPATSSRFRHDRFNRLPHDVIVVDETSMVSLGLMARLLEAVRQDARLVLVGDPEQLASVEAGAVLADIVGPIATGQRTSDTMREQLRKATGTAPASAAGESGPIADSVVMLRANHRFQGVLAQLAEAVRAGAADEVVGLLRSGDPAIGWVDAEATPSAIAEPLRQVVTSAGAEIFNAASRGNGDQALAALGRFRLLCAHRRGAAGVSTWNPLIEEWLAEVVPGYAGLDGWYTGRPVILTANDYGLRLYNGDTGVVVEREGQVAGVAFHREGSLTLVSPSRLAHADTAWAMTVHKAQGSEFDEVALLLPEASSRILTRELFYTAVTRARKRVFVLGTEASVRAAVDRRVARASGLADRLWPS